jgi:hypothetical protein
MGQFISTRQLETVESAICKSQIGCKPIAVQRGKCHAGPLLPALASLSSDPVQIRPRIKRDLSRPLVRSNGLVATGAPGAPNFDRAI